MGEPGMKEEIMPAGSRLHDRRGGGTIRRKDEEEEWGRVRGKGSRGKARTRPRIVLKRGDI